MPLDSRRRQAYNPSLMLNCMHIAAGISHIEFWVSDIKRSLEFYEQLFRIIGWHKLKWNAFSCGKEEIYFKEAAVTSQDCAGPRHICFLAASREVVERTGEFLRKSSCDIIRGPMDMQYSEGYYTIDFRDPDGYVLEVAYAPNSVR